MFFIVGFSCFRSINVFPLPKEVQRCYPSRISQPIRSEFMIGMSTQDVERVFNSARLNFFFDKGLKRYQALLNQADVQCTLTYKCPIQRQ